MAIYQYTAFSREPMQAESIALLGASPDDIIEGQRAMLEAAVKAAETGAITQMELTKQLAAADLRRLPVEMMGRVLDPGDPSNPDYHYTAVISKASGLAMYPPNQEGRPNFMLLSSEVTGDTEDFMDLEVFEDFGNREQVTHNALQLQPFIADGRLQVRQNDSFGQMAHGTYYPFLTVLGADHPVRLAVEAKRAAEAEAAAAQSGAPTEPPAAPAAG